MNKKQKKSQQLRTKILIVFHSIILRMFISRAIVRIIYQVKQTLFSPEMRAQKVIDCRALLANLNTIKQIIPENTKIMPVIKANGYGCEDVVIARELEREKIDFFAVATIDEAIHLRMRGIKGQLLILGYTPVERIKEIRNYALTQAIISEEYAERLQQQQVEIQCHLEIDTGMHRLGVAPDSKAIYRLYQSDYLNIQGIFSHLGSSDSLDRTAIQRTERQIRRFDNVLAELRMMGVAVGITHLQSTYGILNYANLAYDYVRLGIGLYGVHSERMLATNIPVNLKPILSIQARLIAKKTVAKGQLIGYGLDTYFNEDKVIGIVSIGYADGITRMLGDQHVYFTYRKQRIPQIGRICMDMLLVDLTNISDCEVDAYLTIGNSFEELASKSDSLTNEVLSRLGTRLSVQMK
ncbi:alanine racemase [Enterococcus saccharolyticus]|uniref:Alanine racemase n=1 Tax=Candidatus Enterococcus willemsii TaxID=1857215 RepID=A0ABQ6YXC8_9ENTE|nr:MULTISPECIES: alanine racemase [Enterococcus]KAF1302537.1 alanine racemase [Enterococcus sp. CU12B]MCD5002997.1 alanine racemase [Enterococcus saccharolyticus]